MNILFIGGAGFIGSSLVKRFVSDKKYLVFILEPEFANISRLNGYNLTENILHFIYITQRISKNS